MKCLSGKNSYETEREANKAAELGMFLRKEAPKLSSYLCLHCYKYHLTSSKKKQ
ncbi:hypothetical protein GW796_09610 [archaeon]|nr:hypothetical protein [archaeon]